MTHSFTWADFYLVCFAVGFCFSFFSFVFGGARMGRSHLPHFHGHGAHVSPGHVASGRAPAAGPRISGSRVASSQSQNSGLSPFNLVGLMAFLTWFGGAGFLLTRYSGLWFGFGLIFSVAIGLIGGAIIFLFLSRVLIRPDESMDPADYEMGGVLGHVSSAIREHGTGEIVYTQMGTRRVCGARSEGGAAIPKGTEVVVTRYEKGIAYVQLWSEVSGEDATANATADPSEKTSARKERSL
jgi:membrane protein implicated in regulation of membrane protease activity